MEKFGIFELLDTLSALTSSQMQEQSPDTEEKTSPSKSDAAFSPPAYSGAEIPPAEPPRENENAFTAFLARHDALSKKIDGKKQ